jgi:hypothetical protein|nr:MAG TPA: hypothetical protein [Caudoviricetes sp.]
MRSEIPYFLTNPKWYKFDEDKIKYVLTDKAPKEALESYEELYNFENNTEENDGELYTVDK